VQEEEWAELYLRVSTSKWMAPLQTGVKQCLDSRRSLSRKISSKKFCTIEIQLVRIFAIHIFIAYSVLLGITHDELDGIFGVIRKYAKCHSWNDMPEFEYILRQSLRNYDLPVVINHIKDVLAVDNWIHGSMDPSLKNFSRQHNDWNPGMHSAR
jgi:hypothetical protein